MTIDSHGRRQARLLRAYRLDAFTFVEMTAIARRRGVSTSSLVRAALTDYCAAPAQRATMMLGREALEHADTINDGEILYGGEALDV